MKWLVPLALVACDPTKSVMLSVRPDTGTSDCSVKLYVGQKFEKYLSWECDLGQQGRIGNPQAGNCQHALEATAHCEGIECTTDVKIAPRDGYNGARSIEVTPSAPGQVSVIVELAHAGGFHEKYLAAECEVLPLPEITLTCQTRDPASGAFMACPATLPAGWEAHLDVTATIAGGSGISTPQVMLDGNLLGSSSGRDGAACVSAEIRDPRTQNLRCTARLSVGLHHFTAKIDNLPPANIDIVVGAGPGGR